MELENLYFYTATITHWRKLLEPDKYKDIQYPHRQPKTSGKVREVEGIWICTDAKPYSCVMGIDGAKWKRNASCKLYEIYKPSDPERPAFAPPLGIGCFQGRYGYKKIPFLATRLITHPFIHTRSRLSEVGLYP